MSVMCGVALRLCFWSVHLTVQGSVQSMYHAFHIYLSLLNEFTTPIQFLFNFYSLRPGPHVSRVTGAACSLHWLADSG